MTCAKFHKLFKNLNSDFYCFFLPGGIPFTINSAKVKVKFNFGNKDATSFRRIH